MSKGSSNACSLFNYFENNKKHNRFHEIVKGLCVSYIFSPKKSPGITVLAPNDKLLDQIEKLYESNDYNDVVKAREIVKSLVIKADIKSMDDWLRYSDDAPNWLGQKVPIKVDGGKVMVNGQPVVMDGEFNDVSEKRNLAVWLLQGDKGVGVSNPESTAKMNRVAKKDKKGSYQYSYSGGAAPAEGLRGKIATVVENIAVKEGVNTFISHTADLLKFMKNKNEEEYRSKLLPNVTLDSMVDFYLLVDPHSMASTPLINDVSLRTWWGTVSSKDAGTTGGAYVSEVEQDLKNLNNESKMSEVVESARVAVTESGNTLKSINKAYAKLASDNSIAGHAGVYPKGFADYMKSNPEWKMLSDQLKFGIALKEAELQNSSQGERIESLVNMVEDYMSNKGRGIVRFCGLPMCRWGNLVGKNEEAHVFVNTDYFMANASRTPKSLKDNKDAQMLLSGEGVPEDVANIHQYLSDQNVRTLGAQAGKARERLMQTLQELKGFAGSKAEKMMGS